MKIHPDAFYAVPIRDSSSVLLGCSLTCVNLILITTELANPRATPVISDGTSHRRGVPDPRPIPTFISTTDGEQLDPKWGRCAVSTCQQSVTLETSHGYATSARKANPCCCNQYHLDCEL